MVGSALKKLARDNNLTVSNGVAYGNFKGYAVTFFEGMGTKTMVVTTKFANEASAQAVINVLENDNIDLSKVFRVTNLQFSPDSIYVEFHDNPGTMKKIYAFIDWFFPLLDRCNVLKYQYCSECGQLINQDGTWKLINGIAFHMHQSCSERVLHEAELHKQYEEETNTGSYGAGFVGALIGALLGGIIWAVVLCIGYYVSAIGLLVGIFAKKGYEIFHGRKGKGKLPIILFTVIVSIVSATFLSDLLTLFTMVYNGELYGLNYADAFTLFKNLFYDGEYLAVSMQNIGAGLFFALLGVFALLRNIRHENKGFKMKTLK